MAKINNNMLERHSLLRAFDELRDYRIIAVCAPAGYGKTVAVSQWLRRDASAKAVFSIDEYDNNIAGFCERFCVALRTCQPQNQMLNAIASSPAFQSAPEEFTLRAISSLSTRKRTVLVIDDLHLIHNSIVLRALLVFIKRLPSNFQTIFISRNELPLGLSDLWLKDQAARISAHQFLFTTEDIIALLKKRGSNITESQARDISQRTQGWAIGINAFLLSGGRSSDRVYDYLEEFVRAHIWEYWDEATREFMLCTSNLRSLVPALCEELTDNPYSEKFLEELVRKGAFVTRLKKGEYRYHDLFQQFLRQKAKERGDDFLCKLSDKEGYWHLSQGDTDSAIECFTLCNNYEGIAKCFENLDYSNRSALLASKFISVVKHPEVEDAIRKHPHLLILLIWRAFAEGNKSDMVSFMDEYYAKYPEIAVKHPSLAHEIFFVRVLDFRVPTGLVMSESNVLTKVLNKAISKLLSKMPSSSTVQRWVVPMETPMFHRGIRDFSDIAIGDVNTNINLLASKFGWVFGKELAMVNEIVKAEILYEQGNLEEASTHARMALEEVKNHFPLELTFCAYAIYVCVQDSLNNKDSEETKAALASMSKRIDDSKAYHLVHNFSAFTVRREMMAGDIKAAEDWLNEKAFENPTLYKMYSDITTCRALIITEKYDSAIILLKKILAIVYAFNRPLDIIETRILLAIAYWKKKREFQNEALEYLEEAVWTAQHYGFVQMFVNDGAELAGILHKLMGHIKQRKDGDTKYLNFVKQLYTKASRKSKTEDESVDINIKYTEKQIAVMNLLCQGKTYKEMSAILNIKRSTLRSRLELIFNKLEVTNIPDAVKKINELELPK